MGAMCETVSQIGINLLSNVIFWAVATVGAWLYLRLTHYSRLLRFCGIKNSKRIVVYLSKLEIARWGAVGVDGRRRSYAGRAAVLGEVQAAERFRRLFSPILPSHSGAPSVWARVLLSDIKVEMQAAPSAAGDVEGCASFVSLGSPVYSDASGFVEDELRSQARFRPGHMSRAASAVFAAGPEDLVAGQVSTASTIERATRFGEEEREQGRFQDLWGGVNVTGADIGGEEGVTEAEERSGEIEPAIIVKGFPPFSDRGYGFVERIVEPQRGRCVFYVAGLSEPGTVGALGYLTTQWKALYRKYGADRSFLVMLRVEGMDHRNVTVVFEREGQRRDQA